VPIKPAKFEIKPVSGAGPDISVGKKIRALTATSANRKISTINKGPIFWRIKVIINFRIDRKSQFSLDLLEAMLREEVDVTLDLTSILAKFALHLVRSAHSKVLRIPVKLIQGLPREYSTGKN
jgi:hypothetical protein